MKFGKEEQRFGGMVLVISIILLGILGYMYRDQIMGLFDGGEQPIIVITEHGSRYESTGRETYIRAPDVNTSVSQYGVYTYNPKDPKGTSGSTWIDETKTCPDGTYDCLYHERVNNGRVTKITDKNGNDLIERFVDDLYTNTLESADTFFSDNKDQFKMDGQGRLYSRAKSGREETEVVPGETMPLHMFIMIVLMFHKNMGKRKPIVKIDIPA